MRTHRHLTLAMQSLLLSLCLLAGTAALAESAEDLLPIANPHNQALSLRLEKLDTLLAKASDYQRYILLDTAARTALELGLYPRAKSYASELLALAPQYPDDWNYAAALHYGNIILGRTALAANDINNAKLHLLAAGDIPASEILNRNGADLKLASALLGHGEREAVTRYLKACSGFWPRGQKKLDHWLQQLEQGESPELMALP